jgi:glycosyltransferase involved in cell wall biosynthesis
MNAIAVASPRVSVVIPHYDDMERLDRCLDALMSQTMTRDQYEIIVADNNSPVGLKAVEAVVAGRARVTVATTRGAGPARNAGARVARGEVLAFTDCDCVPDPAWLERGLAALAQADFVGGKMEVLVPSGRPMTGAEAFEGIFAFDNERYVREKHFTVTANLFCPRDVFQKVGPFRTEVSEDNEWCWRARELGYRLGYAGDAVVGHPARGDWAQLKSKWRRICAERHALMKERGGGALRWIAQTWLELPAIPAHTFRVLRSRRELTPGERWAALRTLVAIRMWRFVEGHRMLLRRNDRG